MAKFGKPFQHVQTVPVLPGVTYDPKEIANSEEIRKYHPGRQISIVFNLALAEYKEGKSIAKEKEQDKRAYDSKYNDGVKIQVIWVFEII